MSTRCAQQAAARRPDLEVARVTPPHPPADTPAAAPGSGPAAAPTLTIDALGRKCPIPIIMLAERIREVPVGRVVAVLADDPAARTDVPAWCVLKSQEFVLATDLPGGGWAFLVRRSY
jgi:tRNA 2-thiouridine synthesizing protein A